jgi:chromosome partitioning protein
MTRVVCVATQKGGAGKTTSAVALAHASAKLGLKVLLVDLDPQGQCYAHLTGQTADNLSKELSSVLDGFKQLSEVIIPQVRQNLDLCPANIKLADMELALLDTLVRETRLRKALAPVLRSYDTIFLDCPPSLGMLTSNGLLAATEVVVPLASDFFSLLGFSRLLPLVTAVQAEGNPKLRLRGIILTRFNRTLHAREVAERCREELGEKVHLFEPPVNESTKFREATSQGKTIFEVAPEVQGALAYRRIAQEIAELAPEQIQGQITVG